MIAAVRNAGAWCFWLPFVYRKGFQVAGEVVDYDGSFFLSIARYEVVREESVFCDVWLGSHACAHSSKCAPTSYEAVSIS